MHQTAWKGCRARRLAGLPQRAATSLPGRLLLTLQGKILNCICRCLQLAPFATHCLRGTPSFAIWMHEQMAALAVAAQEAGSYSAQLPSSSCCHGCCAFCPGEAAFPGLHTAAFIIHLCHCILTLQRPGDLPAQPGAAAAAAEHMAALEDRHSRAAGAQQGRAQPALHHSGEILLSHPLGHSQMAGMPSQL